MWMPGLGAGIEAPNLKMPCCTQCLLYSIANSIKIKKNKILRCGKTIFFRVGLWVDVGKQKKKIIGRLDKSGYLT
jgi:hypothetical protein